MRSGQFEAIWERGQNGSDVEAKCQHKKTHLFIHSFKNMHWALILGLCARGKSNHGALCLSSGKPHLVSGTQKAGRILNPEVGDSNLINLSQLNKEKQFPVPGDPLWWQVCSDVVLNGCIIN